MISKVHSAYKALAAVVAGVALAGCSSDANGGGGGGGGGNFPPCSVTDVTGSIPGVKISIQSDRCTYHVGEPAVFTYQVTTDAAVPTIEITASMGCGDCSQPSEDPMSFVSFLISGTSTGGDPQQYCLCDVGCCAPDMAQMIQPKAATASGTIKWSGRNWQGPSDTGNKEGEPFAPGSYGVDVTFNGRAQGSVEATLPITIIP